MDQGPTWEANSRSASQGIPIFYETRNPITFSQDLVKISYPDPDDNIPHIHMLFLSDPF